MRKVFENWMLIACSCFALSALILTGVVQCLAQSGLRSPAFVAQLQKAASGPALLIDENFEGAGTPTPWGSLAGTPDFDNTSAPLSGAQDCVLGALATCDVYFDPSAGEMWMQCEFLMTSLPTSDTMTIDLYNGAFTEYVFVQVGSAGALALWYTGGNSSQTTDAMSAGTKYWIFFHAAKGTGANAVFDVEFATSATRTGTGNKFKSASNGTLASNVLYFIFDRVHAEWGAGNTYHIDNVKVSTVGWP